MAYMHVNACYNWFSWYIISLTKDADERDENFEMPLGRDFYVWPFFVSAAAMMASEVANRPMLTNLCELYCLARNFGIYFFTLPLVLKGRLSTPSTPLKNLVFYRLQGSFRHMHCDHSVSHSLKGTMDLPKLWFTWHFSAVVTGVRAFYCNTGNKEVLTLKNMFTLLVHGIFDKATKGGGWTDGWGS